MIRQSAFTLVELTVVLAIVLILAGLGAASMRRDRRDAEVQDAAQTLAAHLADARARAMAEQCQYGIAFHIQNAPGSTGQVLNNRSGGHWYRLIGPAKGVKVSVQGRLPSPGTDLPSSFDSNDTAASFLDEVRSAWAGEPITLPARKVRFLALSDLDQGNRRNNPNGSGGGTGHAWYGATYPRPWFGWHDPGTGRWWAWGGYDPSVASSGFSYQGSGPAVVGSTAPATVPPFLVAGDPKPLISADLLDAVIVFQPDGTARFRESLKARRAFDLPPGGCKTASATGKTFSSYQTEYQIDSPESIHFSQHHGGGFVTLAPDALTDQTTFATTDAVMDGILPAYRVYVARHGLIQVLRVNRREGYIASQGTPWPANRNDWQSSATSGAASVWANCRLGFLHGTAPATTTGTTVLNPRGRPISTVLERRMLTERIWWLQ